MMGVFHCLQHRRNSGLTYCGLNGVMVTWEERSQGRFVACGNHFIGKCLHVGILLYIINHLKISNQNRENRPFDWIVLCYLFTTTTKTTPTNTNTTITTITTTTTTTTSSSSSSIATSIIITTSTSTVLFYLYNDCSYFNFGQGLFTFYSIVSRGQIFKSIWSQLATNSMHRMIWTQLNY